MMERGTRRWGLLAALLVVWAGSVVQGQGAPVRQLLLPVVRTPPVGVAGTWGGTATQTGAIFAYDLTLAGSGTQLTGSVRVSDGSRYAVMPIKGQQVGSQLLLDATGISESNGAPLMAGRWCVPTLLLTPQASDGTLTGTWKQEGCNSGRVYLQRPTAPVASVAGSWSGTAIQGVTTFGYTLTLNQQGAALTGLATVTSATDRATMRVQGYAIGLWVVVQETEVLQGNRSAWCLKTVEVQRASVSGGPTLSGSWSATGCAPGEMRLTPS